MRLLAFSYAGGSVNGICGILEALPACFEVIGVELPGRGLAASEPLCWSFDDLVALLLEAVTPWVTDSTIFLGYSFGGLLACELIRSLQVQQLSTPAGLVCFSSMAPRDVARHRLWEGLSEPELALRLVELGGMAQRAKRIEAGLRWAMPTVRADLRCYGQYAVHNALPLACPVLVFRGVDDPLLRPEHNEAWRFEVADEHAEKSRIRHIKGGHFCHKGNEKMIKNEIVEWASAFGVLPDGLALDPHQASRFVWRPLCSGEG